MEFDLSILQLQHILKKLDRINDIDKSAKELEPLFLKYKENSATLVYYMALSIDEILLDELVNDSTLGSLLSNATPINPQWFCRVIFKLNLREYIYEIIEYGPGSISNKLLQSFIELFECKNISVDSTIAKVLKAVVCKTISLIAESNQSIPIEMYLNTTKLSKFMISYIETGLQSSKSSDIHRIGLLVLDFLCQLENCLSKIYKDKIDTAQLKFYELDSEYFPTTEKCETFKSFKEVINFLLDGLEGIVKQVSVDVWIRWDELESNDSTVQAMIGNKIYVISETLDKENHHVSKTLKQCLKHFQIKPLSEDEVISQSSLHVIIDKISGNDCKDIGKWYGALMILDEVWSSSLHILFMFEHINCANMPSEVMIKSLDFIIQNSGEVVMKKEFLKTCKQLSFLFQKDVLFEICQRQCIDVFFDEHSEQDIIIAFNKFSSSSNYTELLEEIIVHFLQSPLNVMLFVFKFAVTSKENHLLCAHVIEQLPCVWKLSFLPREETSNIEFPFLHDLLTHLFNEDFNEKAKDNLAGFFNLLSSDFTDSFPILSLLQNILNSLHNELKMEHWERSQFFLALLKSLDFNAVEEDDINIVLALLAQVASRTSWDFESFCKKMAESNRICCELITELINRSTSDSELLRNMALDVATTTSTHFCDLWLNKGIGFPRQDKFYLKLLIAARSQNSVSLNLEQVIMENDGLQNLIIRLSFHHLKIIPILHRHEWFPLFNNCVTLLESSKLASPYSAAFEVFSNAMSMLAIASDSKTHSCLEYCLGNFSHVFHLLLPNLSNFNFKQIFKMFLKPVKKISCPIVKNNCFYLVLPILLKSIQNYLDQNLLSCDNDSVAPFILELETHWRDDFVTSLQLRV